MSDSSDPIAVPVGREPLQQLIQKLRALDVSQVAPTPDQSLRLVPEADVLRIADQLESALSAAPIENAAGLVRRSPCATVCEAGNALDVAQGITAIRERLADFDRANAFQTIRTNVPGFLELIDACRALSAALVPPVGPSPSEDWQRINWIVDHVDRGHGIVKREQFDECDCGATYWRVPPVGPKNQTPERADGH